MKRWDQEERLPLKNKRILITRPREQSLDFISMLRAWGARTILFPTIRIGPPRDWEEVDKAISSLEKYDTVIFTSVNGVKYFSQRLTDRGLGYEALRQLRVCAIGPQTAAHVEQLRVPVYLMPKEFRAEAIVDALEKDGITGRRFLLPRAESARDVLPREIRQKGGYIDVVTAYRTNMGEGKVIAIKALLGKHFVDVITFTSSSTVRNFVTLLSENSFPDIIKGCKVACIGPVTAEAAASLGIRTDIVPQDYTIQGLTEAIVRYYQCN